MNYEIKRGSTVIATITPEGTQKRALMGQDTLNCSFTLGSFIQFAIGDTIAAFGSTYVLNQYPQVTEVSSIQFDYKTVFEAQGYDLAKVQYMFLGDDGNPEMADFPLMADAGRFIDLIVSNMNRLSSGWSKGTVDTTAYVNISFAEDSCLAALRKVAQQFELEFWIENKVINMTKKGQLTTLSFAYGKDNGLYSIQRAPSNDKDVFSRLYIYGSTKNIPASYGKQRLTQPFIQKTQQFNDYGLIETTLICDGSNGTKEIYPHRTGTISAIGNAFTFTDSGMDFDVNAQLMPGIEATVHFQTGQLSGYEFTINSYNAGTKTFVLNPSDTDNGMTLPDPTGLKPAIGDTYVLLNIIMPASYITAAETELATAGNDYYDTNSNGREIYTVDCDPLYFETQNIDTLNLGDFVTITDTAMDIDRSIRLIGIERDLQYTFKYNLTLADTASIANIVREYFEQQQTQIIIKQNKLGDVARARRNWRNTADLENMVFDPEGDYYTEKIKPGSIETLYLAVGAKAQNYSLNGVTITPNVLGNPANLNISAGQLVHYTLEVPGVGSVWNMTSGSFTGLDPAKAYYLFARISTTALTGQWRLLEVPVTVDSEAGYYNLGVGVLFAVEDGYRSFEFNKGMTYIVGDMIKTGRIQSIDAQNYFDLTQGQFNLGGATSGLDWDVTRPDTLTIRGSLVQNTAGDTSPLGVNRGVYNAGATYYPGDRVYNGGSTWLVISAGPITGSTPSLTNTDWRIDAAAGKSAARIIYNVSDDENTAPDLDTTNADLQGWTIGAPGEDLASVLALNDAGDVLVTGNGDELLIGTTTKYVWMTTEELNPDGTFKDWTTPTRITGRTGVNGPYVDVRWQINGSPTEAPVLVNTDPEPAGWTVEQPAVSPTDYLWMIQCNRLGNGVMTTLWSDPVRMQGKDGAPGASLTYRGEWDAATEYHGTTKLVEAVHYAATGLYYFSRSDAGTIPVGTLPTDDAYWNEFGAQFESIATGLLLAQEAYVKNLIVGRVATDFERDPVTGEATTPYLKAEGGEVDFWDAGTKPDDESNPVNSMVRIGKNVGYMQASGGDTPGVSARDGVDGSYSEMTSEGIFTNGSNVVGLPVTSGFDTNASIVGLLTKGNSSSDGISAAILGINNATSGSSQSFAAYLIGKLLVTKASILNGIQFSTVIGTESNYNLTSEEIFYVSQNTTGAISVYLPASPGVGECHFIYRATASGVSINGNGKFMIKYPTKTGVYGVDDPGNLIITLFDGAYWRLFKIA